MEIKERLKEEEEQEEEVSSAGNVFPDCRAAAKWCRHL